MGTTDLTENEKQIRRLAALAVASAGERGQRVLLLGAGASIASGVPTWAGVCQSLADRLHLGRSPDDDPIELVRDYFRTGPADASERFWSLYPEVSRFDPSAGYAHLANLMRQGVINLVITTNWDPLVEIALSRVLRPDGFRVLVRGEVPDDILARAIRNGSIPKVLKLHGDLSARLFHVTDAEMPNMSDELRRAVLEASGTEFIVAGSSLEDPDLVSFFSHDRFRSLLYYVNPSQPVAGTTAHSILRGNRHQVIHGDEGRFDDFFVAFDLAVQRERLRSNSWDGVRIQDEMIEALERGSSAISHESVARYVEDFARKIQARSPDLIAFVDDRRAPGGTEIHRRLMNTPVGAIPQTRVAIESDLDNRVVNRRAELEHGISSDEAIRIVVVDSVTFSGNTLRMAAEALSAAFPHAAVEVAALVVSRQLLERSRSGSETWLRNLTYQLETDRHEITFPWGSTYSTDVIDRQLNFVDPPRRVRIFRKPWGSGEIFVDQENCSVRVLTVEAGQKLSFQQHLCRDELFVALDDATGFDISGHDFGEEEIDQFDPRIESVTLGRGDYLLIPKGVWHRARALRSQVRLLEIGLGIYDEDHDIDRLLDSFGRGRSEG